MPRQRRCFSRIVEADLSTPHRLQSVRSSRKRRLLPTGLAAIPPAEAAPSQLPPSHSSSASSFLSTAGSFSVSAAFSSVLVPRSSPALRRPEERFPQEHPIRKGGGQKGVLSMTHGLLSPLFVYSTSHTNHAGMDRNVRGLPARLPLTRIIPAPRCHPHTLLRQAQLPCGRWTSWVVKCSTFHESDPMPCAAGDFTLCEHS